MTTNERLSHQGNTASLRLSDFNVSLPRKTIVGIILVVALLAFELFNFDTTQYALRDLLGNVQFVGLQWATILAIAFCAIDFAGLVRLFTPDDDGEQPKEVWYLMGAWLLGATMNAMMTWWAISLTLLNHNFGNEVLSREQLLHSVPIFVAVLVWLTRILFIGAFTVAGDHIFDFGSTGSGRRASDGPRPRYAAPRHTTDGPGRTQPAGSVAVRRTAASQSSTDEVPDFLNRHEPAPRKPKENGTASPEADTKKPAARPKRQRHTRVRQRPPMPNGARRASLGGLQARGRRDY